MDRQNEGATRYVISLFMRIAAPIILTIAVESAYGATNDTQAVTKAIQDLAVEMLSYAAILAAAGTVSMALLELFKGVTDARLRFHSWRLSVWLGNECENVLPELLYLAIGDRKHKDALCGQPLEKMMGQLQAAARLALDYPERFPCLFAFLTSTDIANDATYSELTSLNATAVVAKSHEDRETWKTHAKKVRENVPSRSTTLSTTDSKEVSDAAQARTRLASLVSRKLDGFQLRTQFLWDRLNQGFGLAIGVGVVWYAVGGVPGIDWFDRLALGVVGGLLAPFAKDFSKSLASFAAK